MKSRLVYEEPVETGSDEHGRPVVEWVPRFELWAAVSPLSAREAAVAEQTKSLKTHTVVCRWRPGFSIDGRLRFKNRSRTLGIESVTNVDEAGVQATIDAIEEVTPTPATA